MVRPLAVAASLAFLTLVSCRQAARRTSGRPAGRFQGRPSDPACLERAKGVAPEPKPAEVDPSLTLRTCDGQTVFETAGEAPITEDQLLALNRRVAPRLMALNGVQSVGIGGCCAAACLHVELRLCATPVEEVLRLIVADAQANGLGGARVTVHADVSGPAGPRCARNDPQCAPTAYSRAPYWPDRDRHAVHDQIPELAPLSGGACEHDGECSEAGCGNHCVPWHQAGFAGTCEGYSALEPALCGCVERQCTWFTQ